MDDGVSYLGSESKGFVAMCKHARVAMRPVAEQGGFFGGVVLASNFFGGVLRV